jgi:ParB/RepB/Spo0J family partition protein
VFVDALNGAQMSDVPLADIDTTDKRHQFRFSTTSDDLRASIAREGQAEPIDLVGPKPYRIVDGFRRVQAIAELGWATVKAIIHGGLTEETAHRRAFVKNVKRLNFSPLERANAIRLAKERGMKRPEIAEAFGMSERQVERYEQLLTFPKPIQGFLNDGEVTMAHAVVLATFDGINLGEWVFKLQEKKWSAAELRRALRKAVAKRQTRKTRPCVQIGKDECRAYARRFSATTPAEVRAHAVEEYERLAGVLKNGLQCTSGSRTLDVSAPEHRERDGSKSVRAGAGEQQRSRRRRHAERPREAAGSVSTRRGRTST